MDNKSLPHVRRKCQYHIGETRKSLFEMRFNAIISIRDIPYLEMPGK